MLIFGSIGLFVRKVDMPSSVLALVRGSIGTLFLLAVGVFMKKRISFTDMRKNKWLLLFSGAAIGVNWIFLFEAYRYTTIAAATLCYYLAPVFVMLVSPFFLKEKLSLMKIVCILSSLAGMALVAGVGISAGGSGNEWKGILFGILAAVLYASVVIMNKKIKEIKAIDMTISQLGVAALVLLPYVLLTENVTLVSLNGEKIILLLFVGIVNTGVAYLLYFSAIKELNGQTMAIFSYIDPVAAIMLSAILLHEKMTLFQMIGAILILGSTLVSEFVGKREIPLRVEKNEKKSKICL